MYLEVERLIEDIESKTILNLLYIDFEKICYEITKNAELQECYRQLITNKELFLEEYTVISKLVALQPVQIDKENVKELEEFRNIIEQFKIELMKEAYFRGIKDTVLLLKRADLFKENL